MAMCLSNNNLEHTTKVMNMSQYPSNQAYQIRNGIQTVRTFVTNCVTKSMILMEETVRTFVTNWNNHIWIDSAVKEPVFS